MFLESPESRKEFHVRVKENEIIEQLPIKKPPGEPNHLTIEWAPDALTWKKDARVSLSLYGYQEIDSVYPKLTYLVTLAEGVPNTGSYELDLDQLPPISPYLNNYEYTFGFIGINMTGEVWSQTIWSSPMPLGKAIL